MKKKITASFDKSSSDFESFIGELSASLVNLQLNSIDDAIESRIKKSRTI